MGPAPQVGISAATQALLDRAGGNTNPAYVSVINTLNNGLISSGIMAKADKIHFFPPWQNKTGAYLNWASTSFNAVDGSTAPTFFAGYGISTDGIASFLDLNWAPTDGVQFTRNNAEYAVWRRAYNQEAASFGSGTSAAVSMAPRGVGTNTFTYRINQASSSNGGSSITDGFGLWAAKRTGSNATLAYRNGVQSGSSGAVASTALDSAKLAFGKFNTTGFQQDQVQFVYLGAALSDAENLTLYNLVNAAITALGIASIAPAASTLALGTAVTLPDGASGSQSGKGFTCTGLALDPQDGTWWVGNHGKATPASPSYASSIVHLSADFSTFLGEITMASLGLTPGSVQGVAYDTSDNTLWAINKQATTNVINVSKAGALNSSFNLGATPNGLGYDATLDQLPILTDTTNVTTWYTTAGAAQTSPLPIAGIGDQLYVNTASDMLLRSVDATNGQVYQYSYGGGLGYTTAPLLRSIYTLTGATSIEGAVRNGNTFYVCDDAYYHGTGVLLNQIISFPVT